MIFEQFAELALTVNGVTDVHSHGGKDGAVIEFGRKAYKYSGSYADILRRLGVRVCYSHDLATLENALQRAKDTHGKKSAFGFVRDNSAEIDELIEKIDHIKANYIIVD